MSRPWMQARPRKSVVRREIAEAVLFIWVLVVVIAAMSLDYVP